MKAFHRRRSTGLGTNYEKLFRQALIWRQKFEFTQPWCCFLSPQDCCSPLPTSENRHLLKVRCRDGDQTTDNGHGLQSIGNAHFPQDMHNIKKFGWAKDMDYEFGSQINSQSYKMANVADGG